MIDIFQKKKLEDIYPVDTIPCVAFGQALSWRSYPPYEPHSILGGSYLDTRVDRYFQDHYPRVFSKNGFYRAVGDSVKRPEHLYLNLPKDPNERDSDSAQVAVEQIADLLDRHPSIYFKPGNGSSGVGIVRVTTNQTSLRLNVPHNYTARALGDNLSFMRFYLEGYASSERGQNMALGLVRPGINRSVKEGLKAVIQYGLEAQEYCVEAAINMPLYSGSTWEIRNIVQSPNATPQVTANYGKVGATDKFSNLSLGGGTHRVEDLIEGIYQQQGRLSSERPTLVDRYLEKNHQFALRCAGLLKGYMQQVATSFFCDLNPDLFYPREFYVDITAELDGNNELAPVLGEMQFSVLPEISYIPALEKVNPLALDKVKQVREQMRETDIKIVTELLRTSPLTPTSESLIRKERNLGVNHSRLWRYNSDGSEILMTDGRGRRMFGN